MGSQCGWVFFFFFLQYHAMLSVELQVEGGGDEGVQGAGLRLGEGIDFGDGLG